MDINSARVEELSSIATVGQEHAEAIVRARTVQHQLFRRFVFKTDFSDILQSYGTIVQFAWDISYCRLSHYVYNVYDNNRSTGKSLECLYWAREHLPLPRGTLSNMKKITDFYDALSRTINPIRLEDLISVSGITEDFIEVNRAHLICRSPPASSFSTARPCAPMPSLATSTSHAPPLGQGDLFKARWILFFIENMLHSFRFEIVPM